MIFVSLICNLIFREWLLPSTLVNILLCIIKITYICIMFKIIAFFIILLLTRVIREGWYFTRMWKSPGNFPCHKLHGKNYICFISAFCYSFILVFEYWQNYEKEKMLTALFNTKFYIFPEKINKKNPKHYKNHISCQFHLLCNSDLNFSNL